MRAKMRRNIQALGATNLVQMYVQLIHKGRQKTAKLFHGQDLSFGPRNPSPNVPEVRAGRF